LQPRDYQIQRDRLGFGLNFDYKPDDLSNYFLRTVYSKFKDDEQRNRIALRLTGDAQLPDQTGNNIRVRRELKDRVDTQEIKSVTFGGEKSIDLWTVNGQASYTESSEKSPLGIANARFQRSLNGVGFSGTRKPSVIAGDDFFNPSSYTLNEIEEEKTFSIIKQKDVKLDFARLYDLNGYDSQVKFGAKHIGRNINNDIDTFIYDDFTGLPTNLSQYSNRNLRYKPGPFGPEISGSAVRNTIRQLDRNAAFDAEESSIGDYRMSEDINAAYVMNTLILINYA